MSTGEHANSTVSDINAESVLAWKAAWSMQFMLMGCQACMGVGMSFMSSLIWPSSLK